MKLLISLFIIFTVSSCVLKDTENIKNVIKNNTDSIKKIVSDKNSQNLNSNNIQYIVGDKYYIEGVKYIPLENYKYNEIGLAKFYGKDLHNTKTTNNDFNKVTELLGRHKTLPLPSIVKVTNLENGLSLVIKINDRHHDNSSIIQLSRKAAQLLKFYKNKITKVRVEILSDPSKQMKIVTMSMNEEKFNDTIDKAPTETVSIIDIDSFESNVGENKTNFTYQPIELGMENINKDKLFLKVNDFKQYSNAKLIMKDLKLSYKFTIQKEVKSYSLIIGPLENEAANNLLSSFISKGYKNNKFILE